MGRKIWIILVAFAIVFTMPMGGAAAQSQTTVTMERSSPPAAATAPVGRSSGKLSARLNALAQSAQLSTASADVQAQSLSLPAHGAGSLIKDGQGRFLVDVRVFQVSASVLAALTQAHAVITHVSEQYQVVTALVAAPNLAGLAALPVVQSVMEELTPLHGNAMPAAVHADVQAPASTCPVGTAVSAGDVQLNAVTARTTYSVTGSGVKVGILSDSFDADASAVTHAADDRASGDLPGPGNTCGFVQPVQVISETLTPAAATDEGRAMVQIVHDIAPDASLAFASAHNGLFAFADNIRALRTAGADIIADDVTYFAEPMFQEGPVAVAIGDVTRAGVVYFTSAGNSNVIIGGHNVGSYESGAYRPAAVPSYVSVFGAYESCHDFNPGAPTDATFGVTLNAGGSVVLILDWSQPWSGVTTDLDVLVTNASNSPIAAGQDSNTITQLPYETVSWSNADAVAHTYNIHVCRFTGAGGDTHSPRIKWVMLQSQGLSAVEYATSGGGDIIGPAIMGHSASLYSLSVAAAPVTDNNTPEDFSSFGPATHYFGPVSGNTPAAAISPTVIHQPDFTASDGGCTTFFALFTGGCWRFFGTSAAAPHAAGVAALLKQEVNQNHLVTLNQGTAKLLLQSTARSMSGGVPDGVGAGLIDALGAITKELTYIYHLFLPLVRR